MRRRSYDWDKIRSFYDLGHTPAECQAQFGISNGAWYAAAQRGAITLRDTRSRPRTKTRSAVAELVATGMSLGAIARELGISKPTVCVHMRRLGIPAAKAPAQRHDWVAVRAYHDAGKRERCEVCGLTEWRGAPISLELHHVNGDGEDNRLGNLRLLCPNCHSQTDTWGGRNKRKPTL